MKQPNNEAGYLDLKQEQDTKEELRGDDFGLGTPIMEIPELNIPDMNLDFGN